MATIEERLDQIYEIIQREEFMTHKGLGNEIGFSRGTAKVKSLKTGDRVVVYAAGKGNRCFVGNFTLKTMPIEEDIDHSTELKSLLRYFPLSCQIKEPSLWAKSLPIKDILDDLSFIGDKKNYGLYLRQGMRALSEGDYEVIVGKREV